MLGRLMTELTVRDVLRLIRTRADQLEVDAGLYTGLSPQMTLAADAARFELRAMAAEIELREQELLAGIEVP